MTTWFDKDRRRWRYHFQLQGRRKTGYCIHPVDGQEATNKKAADRIEALIHESLKKAPAAAAARAAGYTLAEACAWYLENRAKHLAEYDTIVSRVGEYLAYFGSGRDVSTISAENIVEYTEWCRQQKQRVWMGAQGQARKFKEGAKTRGVVTVNKYLKTLRLVLFRTPAKKYLQDDLEFQLLKEPKRDPTPIDYDTAVPAIMAKAAPHLQLAIIICVHTGMREGELLSARAYQWNERQRIINLDATTKSRKARPVYVNEIAFQAVKRAIADGDRLWQALQADPVQAAAYARDYGIQGRGDIPLILYEAGPGEPEYGQLPRPIAKLKTAWRGALKRAGLSGKVRFHDTRASFCTYLAHLGRDILDIKTLAGHEDIDTTMRYVKAAKATQRAAVDDLAAAHPIKLPDRPAHENRTQKKTGTTD